MTFTGWLVPAGDHKSGFFALAPQDKPGTFVEPTVVLRETGGEGMLPDAESIVPKYFAGTQFQPVGQAGASGYDGRTVNVEMDARTLALGIRLMYGEPTVTAGVGTVVPYTNRQWAQFFPARCFSGYWYVPTIGHVKFYDAQLYMIQATVPDGNEFITGQLGFHAAHAEYVAADTDGYAPPTVAIPDFTGAFSRSDATLLWDGAPLPFEGGITVNINRPIDAGGKVGQFTGSYKPGSGYVMAEVSTTLTGGRPDIIKLQRGRPRLTKPLEVRLAQGDPAAGGVRISLKAATAQVTVANAPISDGAVTTTMTAQTVIPNPAAKPFTVELEGAYT